VGFSVSLARPVPSEIVPDLEKNAAYVSTALRKLRVLSDRQTVEVECESSRDDEVRAKVTRFLEAMTSHYRPLGSKVVWQTPEKADALSSKRTTAELLERKWLFDLGNGQMGFAGPAVAVMRALDRVVARMARGFGAVEHVYPSLIPANVLAQCGYFASCPQSISLVSHLGEDFDAIEELRQANVESSTLNIPRSAALSAPDTCLVPAACYHCYQALAGTTVPADGFSVTTVGKCFRYESSNMVGIERLWDFTMREIVLLGTEESVVRRRADAIEAVKEHIGAWGMECSIESATDPFSPTMYAAKTFWQLSKDTKFEMRLPIDRAGSGVTHTLACGSFNLAGNLFGHVFDIKTPDGAQAFTACVGWGYERWVLAVFAQHGLDVERWPAALRDAMEP
jgi:seryl-tRNA synthetase